MVVGCCCCFGKLIPGIIVELIMRVMEREHGFMPISSTPIRAQESRLSFTNKNFNVNYYTSNAKPLIILRLELHSRRTRDDFSIDPRRLQHYGLSSTLRGELIL